VEARLPLAKAVPITGQSGVGWAEFSAHDRPRHWLALPAYILFFLMVFLPTAYPVVKIPFLVLTIFGIVIGGRWRIHRVVLLISLVMIATGLGFIWLGTINGAPGAIRASRVFFVWPALYTLFVAGAAREWVVRGLLQVLVLATLCAELYIFTYVLTSAGWLPAWVYVELVQGQSVGFYGGYMEFSLFCLTSLNFAVPFLVAAVLDRGESRPMVPRVALWLVLALGVIAVLLSGRRGIWIGVAISPFVTLALRWFLPRVGRAGFNWGVPIKIAAIAAVVALGFNWAYSFEWSRIQAYFTSALFDSPDAELRQIMFRRLRDGWLQSPVVGFGIGAGLSDFVRSYDQPWAYELSYMALLYQTGLVGITLYAGAVLWIYLTGIRMIRAGHRFSSYVVPVLTGMTSFLIANATNPYLAKYDYLWVIFLPVAVVNLWLVESRSRTTNDSIRPRGAR
jgi:hypothetical protein